jgi:hypothetical protein
MDDERKGEKIFIAEVAENGRGVRREGLTKERRML